MIVAIVILGSLALAACAEIWRPRRRHEFPALRRRVGNVGIWLGNVLLAGAIFPGASAAPSSLVSLGATFLILDLAHYLLHRIKHAVPLLWRLHALHHSDPDLDFSTSVRQHPADFLLASAAFWAVVTALSLPAAAVVAYGAVVFAAEAVQHANTSLPAWLERALRPALVTPGLHLVHHSIDSTDANRNFGAVFSVWDRLFGTFAEPREIPVFGVAELSRADACRPLAMLLTPLRIRL